MGIDRVLTLCQFFRRLYIATIIDIGSLLCNRPKKIIKLLKRKERREEMTGETKHAMDCFHVL